MIDWIRDLESWLTGHGLSENLAGVMRWLLVLIALALVAFVANWVAKKIVLRLVSAMAKKSKTRWDDVMVRNRVFSRMSHMAPAVILYFGADLLDPVHELVRRLSVIYLILVGLSALFAFLNTSVEIYNKRSFAKNRPIKGFVQIAKILLAIFVGIFALATLLNRSPWYLISGLGAMTAVLLLVFKDTILGLVASIRLSTQDLVKIGDWIEMSKYGADGDVIDVSLHHVTVQNWDKTIVTIPAYALVSDSFKNWRGMSESGGRRIKRSIHIDMTSIKFCTDEMLDRFGKFQLLREYLDAKRLEITGYNEKHKVDTSELINGRRLTNVGTFRAYVVAYLENHPKINKEMTFLVRQLQPTDHGLPIEIYVFSSNQAWVSYEAIQSDIFDHLLAVVPLFDLRVFQQPTGADMRALSGAALRTKA